MVFLARLATAIVQAALLYWLTEAATVPQAWPATDPQLFSPLILVASYVPLLALLGVGHIRARPLALWLLVAAIVVAGLGYHDAARGRAAAYPTEILLWPWFKLWAALSVSLFIAHVLVVDAIVERRLMPPYVRHFDTAWKLGVQIALSALFVAVFWGVLHLGAALFRLLDITYFTRLIAHRWFADPATTLAIAVSLHATDVQPALIRGARSVALTLFSWLLPLLAAILCGFLLSLPFVSLAPLWKTHFATTLLLIAAALLIFLINSCYQDGAAERTGSRVKRIAATAGSIMLVPLVALAIWALSLRVAQYGWTVQRIQAAAIIAIATCYAVGYATAVVWTSTWLKRIELTNFATAYAILILVLALFSPAADPARLMVADQVARLRAGLVAVDKFDFVALKFDGARWGAEALTQLSRDRTVADASAVNQKAQSALAMTNRLVPMLAAASGDLAERITVYPADRTLPPSFFDKAKGPFAGKVQPACLRPTAQKCVARFVSLHSGSPDALILLDAYAGYVFEEADGGQWVNAATIQGIVTCPTIRQAVESGTFRLDPHPRPDIVVGDERLVLSAPVKPCPPPGKG